jgi:predicted membrane-bound spermidine synthase/tetratricopeptide (TPR) repeat protein
MIPSGAVRPALTAIFLVSGAAGLAYEIVWARQLSLLFGVSVHAVSAVLAAFMGGLGLGAELSGRRLDRGLAPLRLYAALETALGAYVLLFPLFLIAMGKIYPALHSGAEGVTPYVTAVRFALSVAILIVPTTLMGGTLPALVRHFTDTGSGAGSAGGRLYAVNTLGAVAGCVAAGFFMVENIGLSNTLRVGAALNIIIGAVVWTFFREPSWTLPPDEEKKKQPRPDASRLDSLPLALFGLSGFCALALEVLWTRTLTLTLNNTTYAFSLILAMFLAGIGLGGAAASSALRRAKPNPSMLFGFSMMGVGLFALVSLLMFAANQSITGLIGAVMPKDSFLNLIPGAEPMAPFVALALAAVFPSAFFMGAGFPLALESAKPRDGKVGGDVGRLYAINTAGCVLGSITAGFFIIPHIGVHKGVMAMGWLMVAGGAVMIAARKRGALAPYALSVLALAAPATYAAVSAGDVSFLLNSQKLDSGSEVEFYEEGPSATVLVSRQDTDLSPNRMPMKRLWINGGPIAGAFREALQLERLLAHIPLLLSDDPKTGLVICFGTGSTAGAALTHGLSSVTAVDISKEVFHAAPYFSGGNQDVMKNPRLKTVEEDGRNYLLTTSRKFDFITAEPPPPSNAGVVSLYTMEFYDLVKERLASGGIFSQWIPLHHMSADDLRSLARSFGEVFPYYSVWHTKWDAILLGSNDPVNISLARIGERMKNPQIARSLREIGVTDARRIVVNYMLDKQGVYEFVKDVQPVKDDRPFVEFTAPRMARVGVSIKGRNLEKVLELRKAPELDFADPADAEAFKREFESQTIFFQGQIQINDNHPAKAAALFNQSLKFDPGNTDARYAYLQLNLTTLYSALAKGEGRIGLSLLDDTERLDRDRMFSPQLSYLRGMFMEASGKPNEAERELKRAVSLDPNYFTAIVNLAGLYSADLARPSEAKALYERALKLHPSPQEREAILKAMGEGK